MIHDEIYVFFFQNIKKNILNAPVRPLGIFFNTFDIKNGFLDPKNPYLHMHYVRFQIKNSFCHFFTLLRHCAT